MLVGIPTPDRTTFHASAARRKELTLQLSRRSQPVDLRRAIDLTAGGHFDLGSLVTSRYALAEVNTAFDDVVRRRGLKVVIQPNA